MRIYGPNGTTLGSPSATPRRTSSTGFALPEETAATAESRAASAPKASANIDALVAMQGVEDPTERRKRSVQRGKGALDVLDDLKIGLLSGNFNASTVSRLRDDAEIGEGIANFLPLIKTHAADDAVGEAELDEPFFEFASLEAGPD